jgi:hypothetical protein
MLGYRHPELGSSPVEPGRNGTAALPWITDLHARLAAQCVQAVQGLASCILVGVVLGVLGTALVAVAIPFLCCIPQMPQ